MEICYKDGEVTLFLELAHLWVLVQKQATFSLLESTDSAKVLESLYADGLVDIFKKEGGDYGYIPTQKGIKRIEILLSLEREFQSNFGTLSYVNLDFIDNNSFELLSDEVEGSLSDEEFDGYYEELIAYFESSFAFANYYRLTRDEWTAHAQSGFFDMRPAFMYHLFDGNVSKIFRVIFTSMMTEKCLGFEEDVFCPHKMLTDLLDLPDIVQKNIEQMDEAFDYQWFSDLYAKFVHFLNQEKSEYTTSLENVTDLEEQASQAHDVLAAAQVEAENSLQQRRMLRDELSDFEEEENETIEVYQDYEVVAYREWDPIPHGELSLWGLSFYMEGYYWDLDGPFLF